MAAGVALCACGETTKPTPLVIPAFVVVGDSGGFAQLYRVSDSVETRLSTSPGSNFDPKSAAGRLVFTSNRDGNSEVYISDTTTTVYRRVTNSGGGR